VDGCRDPNHVLRFVLLEGVHDDGGHVGDFLVGAEGDLLPDDFGGDETLGAVRHHLLGEVPRPLGEELPDLRGQDVHAPAFQRGNRQDLPERKKFAVGLDQRQQQRFFHEIDLVDHEKNGDRFSPDGFQNEPVARVGERGRLGEEQNEINGSEGSRRGLDHRPVQRRCCAVNPRRIEENQLPRLRLREVPDPHDFVPRRLGFVRRDGDPLADDRV